MKFLSVLLVTVTLSLFAVSCERHEFEGPNGTKQLHEQHEEAATEGGEQTAKPAVNEEKAAEPAH